MYTSRASPATIPTTHSSHGRAHRPAASTYAIAVSVSARPVVAWPSRDPQAATSSTLPTHPVTAASSKPAPRRASPAATAARPTGRPKT